MIYLASLIALVGLYLDFDSTRRALRTGARELNPVARLIIDKAGHVPLLVFNIALLGGGAAGLALISGLPAASLFLIVAGLLKSFAARKNYDLAKRRGG